jgi:hypothetical protein
MSTGQAVAAAVAMAGAAMMVMVCQIDVTQQDKPQKPDQSIKATTTTTTPPPPPLPQPQPPPLSQSPTTSPRGASLRSLYVQLSQTVKPASKTCQRVKPYWSPSCVQRVMKEQCGVSVRMCLRVCVCVNVRHGNSHLVITEESAIVVVDSKKSRDLSLVVIDVSHGNAGAI